MLIQIDLHLHAAEDRGVFATDHPGAVNDHVARLMLQAENRIAVIDARVVEIDIGRMVGT